MEPSDIPDTALEWQFVRARGPGGQNVNKVATAVQLRVHPGKLGLTSAAESRLIKLAGSRATREGGIVLFCDSARSQARNRELVLKRLCEMISQARIAPRKRVPTKPSRAAKARRLDRKKRDSAIKKNRGKPQIND